MATKKKERSLKNEKEKLLKQIGARIKQVRLEKGHTSYEKLAITNDIDRSQFGNYERGEVDLQISSLLRVLIALDVTVAEFFSKGFDD